MILASARRVLEIETKALKHLGDQLDATFETVVRQLAMTKGRVILTGIGKSGIICRKVAATFASTGTPAFFLHPVEAIHGDLGMIVAGDITIAVSNSGETEELVRLLELVKRQGAYLIAITGRAGSSLARMADAALVYHIEEEGCPLGLAPMASTTTTLALGDALAAAVMELKGFTSQDFAQYHPGGNLGKRLLKVADVIDAHPEAPPLVPASAPLSDCLLEISQKRFGMTAVDLGETGLGIISDGDIRRLLQEHGPRALNLNAAEVCGSQPKTISKTRLAAEALHLMEQHKITALLVVDEHDAYCGVVHLHDLWRTQLV